ncbi:hypothetical protein J3F84DRAFT_132748 [Trichoderma pleuroticola]
MAVCPTLRWPLGVYYRDLDRLGSPLADHQTSFAQLALGYKIVDALFGYFLFFPLLVLIVSLRSVSLSLSFIRGLSKSRWPAFAGIPFVYSILFTLTRSLTISLSIHSHLFYIWLDQFFF